MKYVMMVNKTSGWFAPITFADELVHRDVVKGCGAGHAVVSAGFCRKDEDTWLAYGKSDSLRLASRPIEDTMLLTLFLQEGLAGLQLANYLQMLELSGGTLDTKLLLREAGLPTENENERKK